MNKNVPNILTILRVIAVPFFVLAYYKEQYIAAFIIFVIASLTDMLDGRIARKYNLVSNFGKFMDPLADKILTYSAFCLFAEYGIIPGYFLIIVLFREFAVAGIRMLAAEKGVVIAANIFGKLKTVLQMVAIGAVLLNDFPFHYMYPNNINPYLTVTAFLVYAATLVSLLSGIIYVIQNKQVYAKE